MSANQEMNRYRVSVDIGGTFTDLAVTDERAERLYVEKCLTTPDDPSVGVLDGLRRIVENFPVAPEGTYNIIHATTLITNALVERKGAKTGLVSTKGFRDVLEIGREARYDLYDLFIEKPEPLVPRYLRREVSERMTSNGQPFTPLDHKELRDVLADLASEEVEAVAICFLHSYANPDHEVAAKQVMLEHHPAIFVSVSHEVAPEIREYERTSTTVANACVQPLAERYLGRLEQELGQMGFRGRLFIMLSDGGITTVDTARRFPIRLIESGPAGGALIGSFYGKLAGEEDAIAFDMGGTTAKICSIHGGQPSTAPVFEAGRIHRFKKGSGIPISAPSIELIEIGAGGGSIAYVDTMGLLKVGPESAGAEPGPASYGFGGVHPTVTDADLVLGYLNPDYFLGGRMKLSKEAAVTAIQSELAGSLGLSGIGAAWGVYETVSENMATAIRIHIAEKGRDPAKHTLIATGGAGPVHAYRVAQKVGLPKVVCPRGAGVASAFGLLVAAPRMELVHSYPSKLERLDWDKLNELYEGMEIRATTILREAGLNEDQISLARLADMRYTGQGHEIQVPVLGGRLGDKDLQAMTESFHGAYERLYGRSSRDVAVEALTWRLIAQGPIPRLEPMIRSSISSVQSTDGPLSGRREAYFPDTGGFIEVDVYDRYQMAPGQGFEGPAIIEERESTVVVGPGAPFEVDSWGNLIIRLST